MPWASVIGAVAGPLIGGLTGSDSAGDALSAQTQASQAAIDEQRRQFDLTRGDYAPYRAGGTAALNSLLYGMGLQSTPGGSTSGVTRGAAPTLAQFTTAAVPGTPGSTAGYNPGELDYSAPVAGTPARVDQAGFDRAMTDYNRAGTPGTTSSPGFGFGDLTRRFNASDLASDVPYQSGLQFGLDQGTRAIDNRARAQGLYSSGGTLKELTQFANDYGSTKAADAYNRYVANQGNTFNRLSGIAGTGHTAIAGSAAAGQNMANNVSGIQTDLGNARGAAAIAQGNSWGGAANSIGNWYNQNRMMNGMQGTNNNYNSAGTFQPHYNGYGAGGDYQYG